MENSKADPAAITNQIAAPGYYFKEILTVQEAAEYVGVATGSIYQYVNKKQIPCYKPYSRHLYFKKSELDGFMLRNKNLADYEISITADAKLNGEA